MTSLVKRNSDNRMFALVYLTEKIYLHVYSQNFTQVN
jgi:hypothetical protein